MCSSIPTLEWQVASNRRLEDMCTEGRGTFVRSIHKTAGNHHRNRMLGNRRRNRMGSSKVSRRSTLGELRRQPVSSKKTNNAPPDAA